MNKETPYREQAEKLKQPILITEETTGEYEFLPSRRKLHGRKRRKTKSKWQFQYPLIRILVLSFVLLPVVIFGLVNHLGNTKNKILSSTENTIGYETVQLEQTKDESDNKLIEADQPEAAEDAQQPIEKKKEPKAGNGKAESTSELPSQALGSQQRSTTQAEDKSPTSRETEEQKIIYHKVQSQDTLYKIAMTYYHTPDGMEIIKEANHLTNDQVNIGQILRIPANNSR
ncbi:LysM peptidoglycan-binding domain-containing protein [Bacillus rubiinfantis]|uniref:LysM peptidoglycan-binding domain-containing protein n=1 Tax=Bacillus rubiinfantis TaxID=1499680 RepID=UPI0005A976B7|nr:LysM peptidoglycan-binding domain-containing protein [Bacillus rubiinfantis]